MTYKAQIGQLGEDIACEYLVKNKYKIIKRNYRKKWGEIDIIAQKPDKTIVFVEVKALRQIQSKPSYGQLQPEDHLTKTKLKKLQKTACLYAGHNNNLIKDNKGWQIDLIAIDLDNSTDKICDIRHYENIS
ncbi:YraN family protein [Candidatus Wolfebacteria bacterium]|nr:YraN family protein [Candidatus Wolfebacteria bacterium]